jgi:hypothetical protein
MIIGLPLSMLTLGAVVGLIFGRRFRVKTLTFLIGCCVLVFAYCAWVPKDGQGFEDMGYVIVAMLIAMPLGVGLAGGWILGWRLAAAQARRAAST